MILLRAAQAADEPAIHDVVQAAFGQSGEAELVRLLRSRQQALLETVAADPDEGDAIVGHIVASLITLEPDPGVTCLGIAPLSVVPGRQGEGIGGMLMRHLIGAARAEALDALFLLGRPDYYQRFGFTQTHIGNSYGASEAFMALELAAGCLQAVQASAHYVDAFADSGA